MLPVEQVTILFVDDEPDILNALKRFLKREEYLCEFVNSGMEAVARLKRADVDILVTDIQMPGMNGKELVQHAKKHYPSVIRLVLSANVDFEQTMNNLNSGEIFRYILKPLDPKLFRSIMHDAVDYHRMVRLCKQATSHGSAPLTAATNQEERPAAGERALAEPTAELDNRLRTLVDDELERKARAELLRTVQPEQLTGLEVATVVEPSQVIQTVFSDCLLLAPDCSDIVLGNLVCGAKASQLLGPGFKSILLKALLEYSATGTGTRSTYSSAFQELVPLAEHLDRRTLPKLRTLGMSMNMLYARYSDGRLGYIGFGQVHIIHYQAATGSCALHKSGNPPLGLQENTGCRPRVVATAPGDIMLLYLHTSPGECFTPAGQISDGNIIEKVQSFAAREERPPLNELGRLLSPHPETNRCGSRLSCLAIRIPAKMPETGQGTEGELQGVNNGCPDA